jgi:hypothetical protein
MQFVRWADPMIDLWDVHVGGVFDDIKTSRFGQQSFQTPWLKQVREHTSKPIVGVSRFTARPHGLSGQERRRRCDRLRATLYRRSVHSEQNSRSRIGCNRGGYCLTAQSRRYKINNEKRGNEMKSMLADKKSRRDVLAKSVAGAAVALVLSPRLPLRLHLGKDCKAGLL